MRKKLPCEYKTPVIKSEKILFEIGLAQAMVPIFPLLPTEQITVYDWETLGNDNDLFIAEPNN